MLTKNLLTALSAVENIGIMTPNLYLRLRGETRICVEAPTDERVELPVDTLKE